LPDVVHRHDAGVLELAGGLGVLEEATATLRVGSERRVQHLEGHGAAEHLVERLVHRAGGPLCELAAERVPIAGHRDRIR
jgi:hypothetical protein